MHYKVVFDILDTGYKAGGFVAFGCALHSIWAGVIALRRQAIAKLSPTVAYLGWFIFFGISLLWIGGAFFSTYPEYRACRIARENGTATITEGVVTNFIPMPHSGHS